MGGRFPCPLTSATSASVFCTKHKKNLELAKTVLKTTYFFDVQKGDEGGVRGMCRKYYFLLILNLFELFEHVLTAGAVSN